MSYPPPQQPYPQPPHHPQQPPVLPGSPQQYGPPQQAAGYYPPPAVPPKKTKAWVWIIGGVGAVFGLCLFIGAIGNLASDDETTGSSSAAAEEDNRRDGQAAGKKAQAAPKAKPTKRQFGLGDAVRDGKFEFVVSEVDCSRTTLGAEYLNTKAQGKFCVVALAVKNIGDEPQTFSGGTQRAFDITGAEYENDGGAEFYANENNETFLNTINPGNKVSGKIVFDVPKKTTLTTLELHDSFFSGGVKVALR